MEDKQQRMQIYTEMASEKEWERAWQAPTSAAGVFCTALENHRNLVLISHVHYGLQRRALSDVKSGLSLLENYAFPNGAITNCPDTMSATPYYMENSRSLTQQNHLKCKKMCYYHLTAEKFFHKSVYQKGQMHDDFWLFFLQHRKLVP